MGTASGRRSRRRSTDRAPGTAGSAAGAWRAAEVEPAEGWGWPSTRVARSSPKMHYFAAGPSLCGRWKSADGPLQGVGFAAPGECRVCRKRLARRLRRARS